MSAPHLRLEILVNVSTGAGPTATQPCEVLTPRNGTLNALETRCQHCGAVISERRVAHARRSGQPIRWCSPSCRVKACVARKRQAAEGEVHDGA